MSSTAKSETTPHYDCLITGGKIVTMDAERRIIDNGAIAISGNTIQEICASDALPEDYNARKTIHARW